MRVFNLRVAGTSFDGRQDVLAVLHGNEPCRIVPEPENPHDSNALAIHVAFNGEILHIGFVPREIAAVIAPYLEGESIMCDELEITGGFELEHGNYANYGARVRVRIPDEAK